MSIDKNANVIKEIVVFGVGAAGANTALHLIHSYPAINYTVVDFDIVEDRNIDPGTQPYGKMDLKRPKTQSFQRIAMAMKKKSVKALNQRVNTVKDITGLITSPETTLIIDCFDNAKSRNLFTKLGNKYNVLHIGFSATLSGEAVWDGVFTEMEEANSDSAIDVCEITIARPFIFALTAIASIAISNFIDAGKKTNVYFDKYLNIKKW